VVRSVRGAAAWHRARSAVPSWLLRSVLAFVLLTGLALGLIALVLHLDPVDRCTVLSTSDASGLVTNIGSQPPGWSLSGPAAVSTDVGTANESFQQIRAFPFVGLIRPLITTNEGAREIARAATAQDAGARAGQQFRACARGWVITRSQQVAIAQTVVWTAVVLASAGLAASGVHLFRTRRFWRGLAGILALSGVFTATLWTGSVVLAVWQTERMASSVRSITDLLSYSKSRTSPAPDGPVRRGYDIVTLGDSEYSLLGGASPPEYEDRAAEVCGRSTDSLAAVLSNLTGRRALNLACPSATIAEGIEGPQTRHGFQVPAQLGILQQVRDPQLVTVGIGANDAAWTAFLGTCLVTRCDAVEVEGLFRGKFGEQLDTFTVEYQDMLDDLSVYQRGQDSRPQIVIIGPYRPFGDTTCEQTSLGAGTELTTQELAVLDRARAALTDVLRDGAEDHDFRFVEPQLVPLCEGEIPSLGPDIHPGDSPYRFHPTAVGELKIGMQVLQDLDEDTFDDTTSTPTESGGVTTTG
jgi:lysophospholipase L1-like esterase